MSSACRWFFMRIGLRLCLEIWRRQDALSEAMSVCPCWSATKMPATVGVGREEQCPFPVWTSSCIRQGGRLSLPEGTCVKSYDVRGNGVAGFGRSRGSQGFWYISIEELEP
eukprot:774260-Pelagomonas_calceolata.AAC.1